MKNPCRFKTRCRNALLILAALSVISCARDSFDAEAPDPAVNPTSEYFVLIGDIQAYTCNASNNKYFSQTISWIQSRNREYGNMKCILQNGDVTDTNDDSQWNRFREATAPIADEIPLIVGTGNHDYDWDENMKIQDRRSSKINSYAPNGALRPLITDRFETGSIENYVAKVRIQERCINFLVLEFAPRREVVEWAASLVAARPNDLFILMTHELIYNLDLAHYESHSCGQFIDTNSTYTTPLEIWNKLIYPNANILCAICGHNSFSDRIYRENEDGRQIPIVLFNLQYQVHGGDGMVQLWEFPQGEPRIEVRVYNVRSRRFHPDPSLGFQIELPDSDANPHLP